MPDGRHLAGLTGRLVELLAEPVPTTCLSMYLVPHTNVVIDAVAAARAAGFAPDVHTMAKAVGSDVTNVDPVVPARGPVRRRDRAVHHVPGQRRGRRGLRVHPRRDRRRGRGRSTPTAAPRSPSSAARRVTVSYPPIDTAAYLDLDPAAVDAALARRGLERDGYILFLSRVTRAKGDPRPVDRLRPDAVPVDG